MGEGVRDDGRVDGGVEGQRGGGVDGGSVGGVGVAGRAEGGEGFGGRLVDSGDEKEKNAGGKTSGHREEWEVDDLWRQFGSEVYQRLVGVWGQLSDPLKHVTAPRETCTALRRIMLW